MAHRFRWTKPLQRSFGCTQYFRSALLSSALLSSAQLSSAQLSACAGAASVAVPAGADVTESVELTACVVREMGFLFEEVGAAVQPMAASIYPQLKALLPNHKSLLKAAATAALSALVLALPSIVDTTVADLLQQVKGSVSLKPTG